MNIVLELAGPDYNPQCCLLIRGWTVPWLCQGPKGWSLLVVDNWSMQCYVVIAEDSFPHVTTSDVTHHNRIHSCHKYRRFPGWRGPYHRKADMSPSVFSQHMTHVTLPEAGAGEVRHGQPDGWSDRRGRQHSCRRPRERRSGQRRADCLQTSGLLSEPSPLSLLSLGWARPRLEQAGDDTLHSLPCWTCCQTWHTVTSISWFL